MSLPDNPKYIIALDIGTTRLKCHLFSEDMKLINNTSTQIEVLYSPGGFAEINPESLWTSVVNAVRKCIHDAGLVADQILCLGISSHRGSFTVWDRDTAKPFHNFITWRDLRATNENLKLNTSMVFKILKFVSYCIYVLTRSPRFLTASLLKFTDVQVTGRLLWTLKNNQLVKEATKSGTAMFGTVDTWLLYRLTKNQTYLTDISCASSTGMYDPFTSSWTFLVKMFGIPSSILPNVCDSAGTHFGRVSSDIWGAEIPIACSLADQAASVYGCQCFDFGDVKITLGTGAFLNVNVGSKPAACKSGLYPLVCWKYQENSVYILEGGCHDCGTVIEWARSVGFFEDLSDLSRLVESVNDTDGVYFMPAFSGWQIPFEDRAAGTGFIGIKQSTTKGHMLRAILEGIVYRCYDLYELYKADGRFDTGSCIRINGGVSNNNFMCQSLADICGKDVQRPANVEMSIQGVALLAGRVFGVCNFDPFKEHFQIFHPNVGNGNSLRSRYTEWKRARTRFLNWHR